MNEQIKGGSETPESLESQMYQNLQAAMNEESAVMKEINSVFETTPDRAEAEKIVLEKYVPALKTAGRKSDEALEAWLGFIKKEASG